MMKSFRLALVLMLVGAGSAGAQESFKQVWVTQADTGQVLQGRILELSHDSLSLLLQDNRRVDVPIDRVLRIEARGDSLKNGAAIGAVVFGGLAALGCAAAAGGAYCITPVAINIGLGALVGAGVDAMNGGRSTLYSKGPRAPAASLQFKLRF
jgi:hypothetical protein